MTDWQVRDLLEADNCSVCCGSFQDRTVVLLPLEVIVKVLDFCWPLTPNLEVSFISLRYQLPPVQSN